MYGALIKTFLDDNGIKYSYVAQKIGVSATIFSSMLNGQRKICVEEYFAICATLQVDGNYFVKMCQS